MLLAKDTQGETAKISRKDTAVIPDDGTYKGNVISESKDELQIILRLEKRVKGVQPSLGAVSLDVFAGTEYFGSMRGWLQMPPEGWQVSELNSVMKGETEPHAGGKLELETVSEKELKITLEFPDNPSTTYQGTVDFYSIHFREIRVRIAKTGDIPRLGPFGRNSDRRFGGFDQEVVTIEGILANEGFDTKVEWLQLDILAAGENSGIRYDHYWDEKELHDLMVNSFPEKERPGEWLLNLMVLPGYFGGFQIDSQGEPVLDLPVLTGVMFDRKKGVQRNMGGEGLFLNDRPRQGAAVFWQALNQIQPQGDRLPNHYLYAVMHELGHLLNLEHPGDCPTQSFMSRPAALNPPVEDSWSNFGYCFGDRERFHLRHGFYHEVMPGGEVDFLAGTTERFFRAREAPCEKPGLSLVLEATKPIFDFMEPVTVTLTLTNHNLEPVAIPYLSPGFGETVFWIKKPDGRILKFEPPIAKCAANRKTLKPGDSKKHLVSLAVNRDGFWLDAPGRYQILAGIGDPDQISFEGSAATNVLVKAPTADNQAMVQDLFNRDVAMFIFLGGGEHLGKAKKTLQDLVYCHPNHPLAPQANLALGLNELRGHKSLDPQTRSTPDIQAGIQFLCQALVSGRLPKLTEKRLLATLQFHREHLPRQIPDKIRQRIFQMYGPNGKKLENFLGVFPLDLKVTPDGRDSPDLLKATLMLERRQEDDPVYLSYDLRADRNYFLNHMGKGRFFKASGKYPAFVKLENSGDKSGLAFEAKLSFEPGEEGERARLEGGFSLPGGGPGGGGTIEGTGSEPTSGQNSSGGGGPGSTGPGGPGPKK